MRGNTKAKELPDDAAIYKRFAKEVEGLYAKGLLYVPVDVQANWLLEANRRAKR